MSVELKSKGGKIGEGVSNGSWKALTAVGRFYEGEDKVPLWNGAHDSGQEWTPVQLTLIADRVEQLHSLVPILRELAEDGGVEIS